MNAPSSILVAGSIAVDHLYTYPSSFVAGIRAEGNLDNLSVSYTVTTHEERPGGSGANIAWHLALFHQKVELLSAVGRDGDDHVERLQKVGIGTNAVYKNPDSHTAHAIIATDPGNRQITFFYPGAENGTDWIQLDKLDPKTISTALVAPWQPQYTRHIFEWCLAHNIPCIFDPGQHVLNFSKEELQWYVEKGWAVMVNQYEWELLSERAGMTAQEILNKMKFAVVTRGEEGFSLYQGTTVEHFPACTPYDDRTVNPTGAGDAFRSGFLSGVSREWSLAAACKLGAALASKVVEQEGCQLPSVDMQELSERIEKAYGTALSNA